jgi:four helix bundle protein
MKQQRKDSEPGTKGFEDLKAWQLARHLMIECHGLANTLPAVERFDLAPQLRRSSKSTPANIAEGYKKRGKADKLRFFNIAQGSLEECRYYCILTNDLEYGEVSELNQLLEEVSRLLEAYSRRILNSDS